MTDVTTYCDNTYKRLLGLKAGLYDIIVEADRIDDETHAKTAKNMAQLVSSIEAGIGELKDQCPAEWSPDREALDARMEQLATTLRQVAEKIGVRIPDTTAWI